MRLAEVSITVIVSDDLDDKTLEAAAQIFGNRIDELQEALAAELRNKFGQDKIKSVDVTI